MAAAAMLDSLIRSPHAIAGTTPCPMLPCSSGQQCCSGMSCYDPQSAECCANGDICMVSQGVCCEGRCLMTGECGCCHDRLYRRANQKCCSEAPKGGTHTCLDDQECCGEKNCRKSDEICCGTGQCINGRGGTIGCCNGFTYNRRQEKCCLDHKPGDIHCASAGGELVCC